MRRRGVRPSVSQRLEANRAFAKGMQDVEQVAMASRSSRVTISTSPGSSRRGASQVRGRSVFAPLCFAIYLGTASGAAGEGGAEVQPLRLAQAAAAGRAALGTMVQSADGSAR
jgi:hypothetical protein